MISKSRGLMIAGAILCIIVAVLALISPILFALMIVRLLGIFALVSGGISLFVAIFGKDAAPRWLNIVFALIRIGAGLVLLAWLPSGLNIITLIFAAYLLVEGIFAIFGAFKIRGHKGWIFMLLNGVVTLVLGLLVYAHWPTGAAWILGSFLGISLLFHGLALLMLGLSARVN